MTAEEFNPSTVIALLSFMTALVTLILLQISARRMVKKDVVEDQDSRIRELEQELKLCKERVKSLEEHNGTLIRENHILMVKLLKMEE